MQYRCKRLLVAGLFAPAMLAGCAAETSKAMVNDSNHTVLIKARGGQGNILGSNAQLYNLSTYSALQAGAESTLKTGARYFSIIEPKEIAEATANTAEDFIHQCEIGTLDLLAFRRDPCNLHLGGANPRLAMMMIKVFHEQPADVLTYDAEEVLSYLRGKGLYSDEYSINAPGS